MKLYKKEELTLIMHCNLPKSTITTFQSTIKVGFSRYLIIQSVPLDFSRSKSILDSLMRSNNLEKMLKDNYDDGNEGIRQVINTYISCNRFLIIAYVLILKQMY